MVMDCCELCYKKYITKEGDIVLDRIADHLFDSMKEGYSTMESAKEFMNNPCTCECHKDGKDIMH